MEISGSLFGPIVPDGFHYRTDFVTPAEERELVAALEHVAFADFEMRGVVARRRVAFFGHSYDRDVVPPIPDFLRPLRAAVATWAGLDADAYAMALVNEYRPGSPIGWHRDAPQYGEVAGVSLLSSCRMRLRPYIGAQGDGPSEPRRATHEIVLEPRSAYLMKGPARASFEHQIPPVKALRYSITFRTLRRTIGS
jgi:alkylated DNA repair dioxygenase AlkB